MGSPDQRVIDLNKKDKLASVSSAGRAGCNANPVSPPRAIADGLLYRARNKKRVKRPPNIDFLCPVESKDR